MTTVIARPSSVCTSDQEALRTLLAMHAVPEPRILDCTANAGRMWAGTAFTPHRMDIDPRHQPDTVGDFRKLADLFAPFAWDVIVFDPPHITEAGGGVVGAAGWAETYGTHTAGLGGANIGGLFRPFLEGARQVLMPNGIVLAKLANQVHRGVFQWQCDDFRAAARELGMTPCDELVKTRPSGITDPKWQHVWHARKTHSYWIVVRNGKACHV